MLMVLRNLWRRGTRSLLTILGIAVGVAAVVALGAIAQGIARGYGNSVSLNNDLLVSQANSIDVIFSSLDEQLGERIAAVPDVANVEPGVFTWIAVGNTPYFIVYGYPANSVAAQHYRIVEGQPAVASKQVALGARAAEALKLGIDDTVRLNGIPYRIVGIYETGSGMEESGGVVTLADAQEIASKQRSVSLFQVGVQRGADIDAVVERIKNVDDGLTVSKSSEYEGSNQWTGYITGFAWGLAAIAILVGGLGMMSAMVMSVLERTREIGTLRAVGWSRSRVVRMILGEAVGLSLVGGLLGVIIGSLVAWGAARIPSLGAMVEGGLTVGIMAQGMVTALVLGLVGGMYPAWTAANLEPVEALRYEGGATEAPSGRWARVGGQAFRNLWRRRTRTLISATGIGIGVATLVMLGGLMNGTLGQLNGLAGTGSTGNLTVMQREVADMSLSSLDERMIAQIQAMSAVESASPALLGFVMNEQLPLFIVMGIEPGSGASEHFKVVEGKGLARPNEIMIGRAAADSYDLGVGDTIELYENRYKVAGIFETGVGYEDSGGVLPLREAQRLLGRPRAVSFIFVNVKDAAEGQNVAAQINARYPEARATLSSEFAENTNDLQTFAALMNVIQLLAIFVGGIVVANTMIMSIYERTREIGTLRALGWGPRRIIGQVVQESFYLCLLAALMGAIMGVLVMTGVSLLPMWGDMLAPQWHAETFITAIVVALVLGLLGGIWPAWRASRLQPVEALRYE
jgi:ABC-type antimicrobial peptide transport system permease subunit